MSRGEDREAILTVATHVPVLVIKLGITFLRAKRQANKSVKGFYKEMVRNGIPPQEARKLADEYTSTVSLRYWFRTMGGFSSWRDKPGSDRP